MSYYSISPTFEALKTHNIHTESYIQRTPFNPVLSQPLNRDSVQINQNRKTEPSNNKKRNILLGIGATAVATLGAIYGVKKYQVKNIKNIQKAFQETFMRDDITVEQTKEMLKRYKEIEKIKDREEYIKALFEEAKKNYGFEKNPIKLIFEDKKGSNGFCKGDNSAICITPSCSRSRILNTMHHEFRHAKQHLYSQPERYFRDKLNNIMDAYIDKNQSITPEKAIELLRQEVIPEKYQEWANKCRTARANYAGMEKDFVATWNNFMEVDARQAGRSIDKFVKGKAFTPTETLKELYMKIQTFFS